MILVLGIAEREQRRPFDDRRELSSGGAASGRLEFGKGMIKPALAGYTAV